ncbi:hypothetical protein MHK_010728 [Candidatus Magnetomorum sp. HK-1]|nr:hypothetical protein MHK_010728 [Candidatus Magnetomorum sp. HK-1]
MPEPEKQLKPKTLWHDWFGNLFKVSLIPTGLDVETDVPVMKKLPEADIVIIRRTGTRWTKNQLQRLPDGIRHTQAIHVLIELKYTESINTDAICQIAGYYKFYKIQHKLTKKSELKCFLVSSKTPRKSTLQRFQYHKTRYSGVYHSQLPLFDLFPIISLNDLSDAPHNILFKLFASKKKASIDATKKLKSDLYDQLPMPLRTFLSDYINRCLIEGGKNMDYLNLTQEERMQLRQEWLSKYKASEILAYYSSSEVLSNYSSSEVLSNYTPSEVFSNYSTDQFLAGLSPDQLKALSKAINPGKKVK